MKIKLYEQFIAEYAMKIPKLRINGIFYHGSVIEEGEDIFRDFHLGYFDWNAIWFSVDEYIAEEFSAWRGDWSEDSTQIRICYQVNIKSTGIADIPFELSQRIMEEWALDDFREAIQILENKGYKGWKTTGGIDNHIYDDYAMFDLSGVKILSAKLYIDGDWTDYMSLDEAQTMIEEKRVSNENE